MAKKTENNKITGPRYGIEINGAFVVAEFINGDCHYIGASGAIIKKLSDIKKADSFKSLEAAEKYAG